MKKLYFLCLTLLVTSLSFGQNLATNGGFENWTAGVPDSWPTVDFSDTDLTENTNASFVTEGTKSASVNVLTQSQGDTDIRQTITLTGGTTYTISLDVYATNNEARARIFQANGFSPSVYSDETVLNQWQTISIEYTPASTEDTEFGIRFYDIAANWTAGTQSSLFYIDNFRVEAATEPALAVTSPTDGSTVPSTDVDIELSVQNFTIPTEGHISYTVDGGSVVMKFDTDPINLTGLSEGSHTVDLELVDTNDASLSPAVTASVTFTVSTVEQVANIAALRAGTVGNVYQLSGEALITYLTSFRNQKHIEDATGGILIDDSSGTITSAYAVGDGITGLVGTLGEFSNLLQFVPLEDPGAASSTGNTLPFQTVTLADLAANAENYESEFVKVVGVTFDNTETNFSNGLEISMSQGSDTFNFRTAFNEDYSDGIIPTVPADVTGVILDRSGSYFLMARYSTDFSVSVLSVEELESAEFSLYPNPTTSGFVTIASTNSSAMNVQVYDILGKQVKNETLTNNTLNVSSLKTGIYIVKIIQNNASITRKLVIK